MEPIKLRTWIIWALILFLLGLLADYSFLHLFFREKNSGAHQELVEPNATVPPTAKFDSPFLENTEDDNAETHTRDNFLESLQKCAPEIAAQAISTPEGLVEYLKKSVGVSKEEVSLENYHLTLPNGDKRRVQVVVADNTNSLNKKELRFFKLDNEGFPERLNTPKDTTLESLLSLGKVTRHEEKSDLILKDDSALSLELHDKKVFEFQYNNHGKVLSCRFKECLCP